MDRTTRYASFVERLTNMTGRPCVGPAAWLRQIPDTNLPLGNNPRPIAEESIHTTRVPLPHQASQASHACLKRHPRAKGFILARRSVCRHYSRHPNPVCSRLDITLSVH